MSENPFRNRELCSGGPCASKSECARYMANVDTERARNLYVVVNRDPCICCTAFLDRPNPDYPSRQPL